MKFNNGIATFSFVNIVNRAIETGKTAVENVQSGAKNLMAATSLATATAITVVPAGMMLAPEQAEASTIKTWTSKFGGDGTIGLSGLSDPFSTNGYALFTSYDLDGNEIYLEGDFNRLNEGANPNWIKSTGVQFDANGDAFNSGIDWSIGLESIINGVDVTDEERAKWWSITGGTTRIDALLNTTSGQMLLVGGTIVLDVGSSIDLSRPDNVSSVPVPAAPWLFATGLPLIAAAARKKKESN